ncbi:MAG: c-type cytochrome [Caulobacteraceae bacterium]
MSMRPEALLLIGAALAASTALAAAPKPDLGRAPSPAELAAVDISITPDGRGLPAGSGSVEQGAAVYAAKCQACHGANGAGGPNDRLTGGIGSLTTPKPVKTIASYWPYATTVFDYVRRAMPITAPQSLTNDEVYAVTAYLLSVDGIVPKDARLDAESLPKVRMPNRDGFVSWEPKERPKGR